MSLDPETLSIVNYPADVLRRRATEITSITDEVRHVARRMISLMHEAEGIGLAAPQVGLSWRMFVAHVPEDPEDGRSAAATPVTATLSPTVYINPVLSEPEGIVEPYDEGCLSLPNISGEVLRPPRITITALDLEGRQFSVRAEGLLARCWQHEADHLDGVLILDRMSQLSRLRARRAIKDLERAAH
ncbi:MAG: peptide deformylase [Phycisphaeraceae bacterium]|nr:peptide deformylase [Phycisphaeraceae bacterium]